MFTHDCGNGVTLRLLEARDALMLHVAIVENREHLKTWFAWPDQHKSENEAREWIEANLQRFAKGDGFDAGVFWNGQFAGACGVHSIDRVNRLASMGYWLARAHNGKGIMTRAVAHLCDYFLGPVELQKLEIHCAEHNSPSRAIPERIGFTHEAVLRSSIRIGDTFHPRHIYGMLASEWSQAGGAKAALARIEAARA